MILTNQIRGEDLIWLGHVTNSVHTKGQTKLKWFFQDDVSSKKWTNEFDFTTMRLVFVHFLEKIEDTKKTFGN